MGLVALAIAFSSTTASAQSKTWTRSAGANNLNWGTAGNWSPSGAPTTNGTQVTFSSAAPAPGIINISGSSVRLGNSTVQGGTYNFAAGTLYFGNATLTNNGTTSVNNLAINGANTLTIAGTGVTTINNLTSSSSSNSGVLNVKGRVNWSGSMGNNTGVQIDVGGRLTLGGAYINTRSTLTNTGGVLTGKGDGTSFFTTITDGFVMQNGAGGATPTTTLFIGDELNFDKVVSEDVEGFSSDVTYAGTLNVDLGLVTSALPNQATLQLFKFDPVAKNGSFTNVNLTSVSGGPYDGLSFVSQGGGVWQTGNATNGQYLVFDENSGNLVVVPEPSTIAFAGIGIGMAGWSAWKRRRLAKVLAKN